MVRLSKQKQEKLEAIMNLVEQLGVDRVLGRLRQTKMMSKEVLDDMKEWETDYEKRVALLGFLVSPEGKKAFGALYELAKVHEEQEKLRQEQLAQQAPTSDAKGGTAHHASSGSHGGAHASHRAGMGASNMKNKLRAQMHRKRTQHATGNQQQEPHSSSGY